MTSEDNENPQITAARHLVEAHLQQHFLLNTSQVRIAYVTLSDFPKGLMLFSATKRNVMDWPPYNYIVSGDRVYSNQMAGEFERFLKEHRYFDSLDLNALQMLNLYITLGPTKELLYFDGSYPGSGSYANIKPPVLTQSKSGLTLAFYAHPKRDLGGTPSLWTATVSPDYHLEVHPPEPSK